MAGEEERTARPARRPDRFWKLPWGEGHFQIHLQDDEDGGDSPALYLEFEVGGGLEKTPLFDVSIPLELEELEALETLLPRLKRFLQDSTLPEGRHFVGTFP